MQKLTTKDLTADMAEVAIKAVEAVFDWRAYLKERISTWNDPEKRTEKMRTYKEVLEDGHTDSRCRIGRSRAGCLASPGIYGKISCIWYFAHTDENWMSEETAERYLERYRRRAGISLAAYDHQAYFMGYEFYVDESVLVPRQDTEILVEEALKVRKLETVYPGYVYGSGCILLSILMEGRMLQEPAWMFQGH